MKFQPFTYVTIVAIVAIILMLSVLTINNPNLSRDLTGQATFEPNFEDYSDCFMDCWERYSENLDLFDECNCKCKNNHDIVLTGLCI